MSHVILIDAGTGNLRSVQKALESLGAAVERTDDPQNVRHGGRVVLPGVGAFGDFMDGLRARGLESALEEIVSRGIPLLGICVGMQALFEGSEEMGQHTGLGLLCGSVTRFAKSSSVKIPHTGWNQIQIQRDVPLFRGIRSGEYVYFNHSYYCQAGDSSDVIATTEHGSVYACAVQKENIVGVQFHPEKSQSVGLQLMKNFMEVT